jgi:hypothetical protein
MNLKVHKKEDHGHPKDGHDRRKRKSEIRDRGKKEYVLRTNPNCVRVTPEPLGSKDSLLSGPRGEPGILRKPSGTTIFLSSLGTYKFTIY